MSSIGTSPRWPVSAGLGSRDERQEAPEDSAPSSPPGRLLGLETEYAIRYSPLPGSPSDPPGNDRIYEALIEALSEKVVVRPGDSAPAKHQVFLENGGAFYYEHLPHRPDGGLVEGATPECRSPAQVLVYQRAQERMLLQALPRAQELLRQRGYPGQLGLVKNCRDAEGHVYGAQENYETEIASGLTLGLYRVGLSLLMPVILVQTLLSWIVQIVITLLLVLTTILGLTAVLLVPRFRSLQAVAALAEADERTLNAFLGRFQLWLAYLLTWPMTAPFALLLRWTAFRKARRQMLPFLLSRPVLSGTGSVSGEGRFVLSEKGPSIRRLIRFSISPGDRPIFDTGNLMKQIAMPMTLRFSPLAELYSRRQRLQLGLSDSNGAQVAEYLKVATTSLVLDLVEAGALDGGDGPPSFRRPLKALQAFISDPGLQARAPVKGGGEASALEVQRYYLEKAREHLRTSPAPSLENRRVVELWGEVLEALEEGRHEELVGRLDWVTKRFFLESCSVEGEERAAVLKTLDLRYHELGEGYLARLERRGLAPQLVEEDQVDRATRNPPRDSPAFLRGAFIRRRAGSLVPVRISWSSAWIGGRFQGRLIRFRRPPS